ncbi:MAG: hypothetical protein ACYSUT_05495 [Planctomycetota bacterium]
MEIYMESFENAFDNETVENLLLIAVLGKGQIRRGARQELERRRVIDRHCDFEDSYMTNLSVVC